VINLVTLIFKGENPIFFHIISSGSGALIILGNNIFSSILIENLLFSEQILNKEAIF
jgi:hypothetical protein